MMASRGDANGNHHQRPGVQNLPEQFLALEQAGRREEQYRLLSRHKAALLEELHQEQYRIDCLDHMVYAMQSEDKRNGGF